MKRFLLYDADDAPTSAKLIEAEHIDEAIRKFVDDAPLISSGAIAWQEIAPAVWEIWCSARTASIEGE